MAITKIEQIGESSKITYTSGEILYTWLDGRFKIFADQDTVEAINTQLAPTDIHYKQSFKFSEQTEVYGTSDVVSFVEYLILNGIFFSDGVITTVSDPEAIKMTKVAQISYFAWAKPGSLEAAAVWKAMKLDESAPNSLKVTWADNGKYSQIATDLTILTYS